MKGGTKNFHAEELSYMENHPSERITETAKQVPYHLKYIQAGKPIVKPEGENERILRKQ